MEIKITDSASEYIKEELSNKRDNTFVRVFVTGMGWAGPSFGLALDEQKDTDNVYDIRGIKVLFDKDTSDFVRGFEIDYKKSLFGSRLLVNEIYSSERTCG